MANIAIAMSVFCAALTDHSKEQLPQVLVRAAQCLAVKKFLPDAKGKALTFGYIIDDKSYPGNKVIYVVDYPASIGSEGLVFAILLTERDGSQQFDIQNNASFLVSKEESSGVSFVNPPLGGAWTQEHLAAAIKRILTEPRLAIPVEELSTNNKSTKCLAYTDPQRQGREK